MSLSIKTHSVSFIQDSDMEDINDLLEKDYLKMVFRFLQLKDGYSASHCVNVGHYATRLGCAINLSTKDLRILRVAAIFHDIGKAMVPIRILNKPGILIESEKNIIKKHSDYGEEIFIQSKEEQNEFIASIIKHHHENYDGSGYPDNLSKNDIPLFSRIISVADVFDALTSNRSYRGAYNTEKAIEIMKELKFTQLDPCLTDIFLHNIANKY